MDSKYFEILNEWAKYIDYDPERRKFNILSNEYELHQGTKRIAHINDTYDESGLLSVMMIKQLFLKTIKESRCSLFDFLTDTVEMKRHTHMYDIFMSEEVTAMEKEYVSIVNGLSQQIIGKPLIGEMNYDEMYNKIFSNTDKVLTALDKCKFEIYRKGGAVENISRIATEILIFPSLSRCILELSNAADGIYLVYINVSGSADSYFAFIIKNNGNLFSVNERIDESYRGQHQHARNGRWTEDKRDDIFPYEYIFNYAKHDYKGYATTYEINENQLSFFELSEDVYIPLLLSMLFITRKYNGKFLEGEIAYLDSLLPINVQNITEDSNELMVIEQNDIVVAHQNVNLNFSLDSVLNGTSAKEFEGMQSIYMDCKDSAQEMVDLWGEGFKIPENIISNSELLLTTSDEYITELVGNEKHLRAGVYYQIRSCLAEYMRDRIFEAFVEFGELKAVEKWFEDSIKENLEHIEDIIADKYRRVEKGDFGTDNRNQYDEDGTALWQYSFVNGDYPDGYFIDCIPNEETDNRYNYYDMRTGAKCNCWVVFRPNCAEGIEKLLGVEVPKIIKGYREAGHHASANSLLNMTDPVCEVGTPFETRESRSERYDYRHRSYYKFNFAIGYAKRGFKKMLAEHPEGGEK